MDHPYRSRFHASSIGPQGGTRYKSGIQSAEAGLRHDDHSCHLEIVGSLVDGIPHVKVYAWQIASSAATDPSESSRERTFYEGPLSSIFGEPPPSVSESAEPSTADLKPVSGFPVSRYEQHQVQGGTNGQA